MGKNEIKITREDFELAKNVFNEGKEFLSELKAIGILENENKKLDNERLEVKKQIISEGRTIIQTVGNLLNESKRLDNENLEIKGRIISEARKFQQTQMVLENIFSERRDVINKHFEAIDKGLREGNDELTIAGLKMVGDFVSTNPLGSFEDFKNKLLNDNETLKLDF